MLQVQSTGFDSILNVQEEQSLIEGDAELASRVTRFALMAQHT